jgi:hypothetical protein
MHQAVLLYEQEQQQNQVSYYFRKAKVLELGQGYLDIFSDKTKGWYVRGLQELYDVLYDRIITSEIHPFMKREMEGWYCLNRELLGERPTTKMNTELEEMLLRFDLL